MPRPAKLDAALDEVRRQIEAVVREEQMRDQLTELGNRLALSERLQSVFEDGSPFWCALIEVDYFKRINDRYTYEVADTLLQKIAGRLRKFEVPTDSEDMTCTVSIGWLTSEDGGDETLTERTVLGMLEAAVGAAKTRGRNCTVRYTPAVEKQQRNSVRDDCGSCHASFTVEIPPDTAATGALFCPNCGDRRPRPEGPSSASAASSSDSR